VVSTAAEIDDDPGVLVLTGEQDIATVGDVTSRLALAILRNTDDVVVDLHEVSFLDASTIGVLVRARTVLESDGRSLRLRGPTVHARRLLDLFHLDGLVERATGADIVAG
jgi:anti-sigma B factor antagonist